MKYQEEMNSIFSQYSLKSGVDPNFQEKCSSILKITFILGNNELIDNQKYEMTLSLSLNAFDYGIYKLCDFNDYAIERSILVNGLKTVFLPQKSV
ncbi:hypothetical protein [Lysinibacillus sp. TE18511]